MGALGEVEQVWKQHLLVHELEHVPNVLRQGQVLLLGSAWLGVAQDGAVGGPAASVLDLLEGPLTRQHVVGCPPVPQ